MKIGIVDDELEMRTQLEAYVRRYGEEAGLRLQTACFLSGDALLASAEEGFDILIFDVDMPGRSGLETAREIRARDERVTILFVTNMAQYAINGYEVEAVDYVIKPIGYYDFSMKLRRAIKRARQNRPMVLVVDTLGGPVRLEVSDILYVEVMGHYLSYETKTGSFRVRGSMKEHEPELKKHGFARSHKSYVVNLANTENIQAGELTVCGRSVPLGRAYKDSFLAAYMQYLRG